MSIKLSVVIPMFNEEKICAETAKTLDAYLRTCFETEEYEILFVNDGSRDSCADIISSLSMERVRLTGYPDNRGKGSAVREGVLAARGDYILYTDCDLAYGTEVIGKMYREAVKCGCDVLIGSRNISRDGYAGYTPLRRLMSKTYIKVISLFAGFHYTDSQCGIKCLRRETAHRIFSECTTNGFAFDLEMLILADIYGVRVAEYPVKIINHRQSESKVNPVKDAFRMIRDVRRMKKQHRSKKKNASASAK